MDCFERGKYCKKQKKTLYFLFNQQERLFGVFLDIQVEVLVELVEHLPIATVLDAAVETIVGHVLTPAEIQIDEIDEMSRDRMHRLVGDLIAAVQVQVTHAVAQLTAHDLDELVVDHELAVGEHKSLEVHELTDAARELRYELVHARERAERAREKA